MRKEEIKHKIRSIIHDKSITDFVKIYQVIELFIEFESDYLKTVFNYDRFREEFEIKKFDSGDTNQTELIKVIASQSDLSSGTISRLIKGEKISTVSILKVCKWLEIPITYFLDKD